MLVRLRVVNTNNFTFYALWAVDYGVMYCGADTPNPALKMEAASFSESCVPATETNGDTFQMAVILTKLLEIGL